MVQNEVKRLRQEAEYFKDQDVVLIHIAKRLREAKSAEAVLTQGGISFCVEADEYEGGLLFRTSRMGAFFYVGATDEDAAVALLAREGHKPLPPDLRTHH
ncbi:MAG: hypothetical protein KIT83_17415 [Bryobacterales bacterium]|nr:hypothetical protein [Bryobacterales bacterium]